MKTFKVFFLETRHSIFLILKNAVSQEIMWIFMTSMFQFVPLSNANFSEKWLILPSRVCLLLCKHIEACQIPFLLHITALELNPDRQHWSSWQKETAIRPSLLERKHYPALGWAAVPGNVNQHTLKPSPVDNQEIIRLRYWSVMRCYTDHLLWVSVGANCGQVQSSIWEWQVMQKSHCWHAMTVQIIQYDIY